uniref:Uncharacterized protein n=1 Tax=Anguilla anguilla TaxID=7936 RepID=A0A0E9R9H1_ANGAN
MGGQQKVIDCSFLQQLWSIVKKGGIRGRYPVLWTLISVCLLDQGWQLKSKP